MESFKGFLMGAVSAVLAYFHPISDIVFSVFYVMALNFVFGLLAGMAIHDESFSFKKAFMCIVHTCIYFLIVASIYFVGEHMGNSAGAIQCVTAVTYALLWFLCVNIFRNLRELFPSYRWIGFIYYALSMEFVKKIPFMENFLKTDNDENIDR